jgi:hypothetical protein
MTTAFITEVEGNELHRQYSGQHAPQPCFVEFDCDDGELRASYNPEIGNGVPFNVWHRRAIRWRIPALTAEAANGLLADILPYAETILAGYESEWDGHNHVGSYTDAASEAIEAVNSLCDRDWDGQSTESWDAGDWFGSEGGYDYQCRSLGITAATTDEEIAAIADRQESDAHPRILTGAIEHLTTLRDHAIDAAEMAE